MKSLTDDARATDVGVQWQIKLLHGRLQGLLQSTLVPASTAKILTLSQQLESAVLELQG
jgi:hypothetical protein